jgi:LysE type translocator
MASFVPELSTLLPFLVAALTLNLTPGADMTYVIARSAGQGRLAGISSAFGVSAGALVHSLLAALGLSALVMQSETAFQIIKFAGAAYLLYLAWKAWRSAAPRSGSRRGRRQVLGASSSRACSPTCSTPKSPCSSWLFCRCSSTRRAAASPARSCFSACSSTSAAPRSTSSWPAPSIGSWPACANAPAARSVWPY